jgi:dCMP deaminase
MKSKFLNLYMDWARRTAQLSYAQRLQVGAVIVKDDSVVSYGYNGMPTGWDNNCEYKEYDLAKDFNGNYFPNSEKDYPYKDDLGRYRLKTRPEVLHAERNALDKLAKKGNVGGENAIMFVTHAPCLECAKSIYSAGIAEVYYDDQYRNEQGIEFLKKCGIKVQKYNVES